MNTTMKLSGPVPLLVAVLLLGVPFLARAQEPTVWYRLGAGTVSVPRPAGVEGLNCLLPENSSGYVAVWDTADSAVVERRAANGSQLWQWTPPTPLPETNELTRVVLSSLSRTLWCSSLRWFFLSNSNGVPVRSGSWSLPYLDPTRILIQNENLYVLYGTNASVYNTNMEFQATIAATLPTGYWQNYAGAWLLDLSNRTNHTIRLATLNTNIQVANIFEVQLPTGNAEGYTDHRVLGADADRLFVASCIYWPSLFSSRQYFTLIDRNGNVGFQHYFDGNQILTGSTTLDDGWVLSARSIGETEPRHLLYHADAHGRPQWQVIIGTGAPQQYRVLNTLPPRVLEFVNPTNLVIRPVVRATWFEVWRSILWPDLHWSDNPGLAPAASTNYFWITPFRLNNS